MSTDTASSVHCMAFSIAHSVPNMPVDMAPITQAEQTNPHNSRYQAVKPLLGENPTDKEGL
jgi:hypothetical protein